MHVYLWQGVHDQRQLLLSERLSTMVPATLYYYSMNSNHLIFAAEVWVMVGLASLEHEINLLGRLEMRSKIYVKHQEFSFGFVLSKKYKSLNMKIVNTCERHIIDVDHTVYRLQVKRLVRWKKLRKRKKMSSVRKFKELRWDYNLWAVFREF